MCLPVNIFENQNTVTLAGWFGVSDDIVVYGGEIGIHAPDENVAFRSDSKGSYHGNSYLWGVGAVAGIDGDTKVKPVFDTWYHMAYIIDGMNHKFEVYQNGAEVYSSDLVDTFSPSQFNESGGHFYLGQSAYEDNHEDWKGRMSDFRVYGGALSVIQSFTKPDLKKCCNGGPITLEFNDTVFRNDTGVRKVAALVKTFIQLKGHQLQLNSVNRDALIDARKNPDAHKNMIVRVWGWSGYFNELSAEYQDHVIKRLEYSE